jgi:hypothetical protein
MKQTKDIDQHYVDLINGKIKPVTPEEIQFLKDVEQAKKDGFIVEIPMN